MTLKVKVVGAEKTASDLADDVEAEAIKELHAMSVKAFAGLKRVTPVDTGRARNSWFFDRTEKGVVFTNNVDYIKYLNEGSSKQAPAKFIEQTVQRFLGVLPVIEYFKKG